jgi:DNA polymerase
MNAKSEAMRQLKDDVLALGGVLADFRRQNNYLPVIGEGTTDAKIFFIGEAPGKNEALTGRPFCGASGKLLDTLLSSIEISRLSVYIGNIVKDRPPENRDPLPNEIELYAPFLDRQIDIIQPKVIATLGRFSMGYIMRTFGLADKLEPMSQAHGKIYEAQASYGLVKIVPLYHPAASIYNQELKATLVDDFKILKGL